MQDQRHTIVRDNNFSGREKDKKKEIF